MTASAHAVVGASIAAKIPDWRISIPLILLSHALGDLPNHWDVGEGWQKKGLARVFRDSLLDFAVSYLIVAIFFVFWLRYDPVTVFLGALIAQLPDYFEGPYFILGWHSAPWRWVNDFQMLFHKKLPSINLTLTGQIVLCSVFILLAAL